jgi:hypothetical protein
MAGRGKLPFFPMAGTHTPHLHYSARVKGGWLPKRFFCGPFPFFAPQKKQKNRETVQK